MSPQHEYEKRRAQWQERYSRLQSRFIAIGNGRLACAVLAIAFGFLAWDRGAVRPGWVLLPVMAFVVLFIWHQRVIRIRNAATRAISHYDLALERLSDRWSSPRAATGAEFLTPKHVYAADLDLFGRGSLFQMISTARTSVGRSTLAGWLLVSAGPAEIRGRQVATGELAQSLDLLESFALSGADVTASIDVETMDRWGSAPPAGFARWQLTASYALGAIGLILLLGWFGALVPIWGLGSGLAVNLSVIVFLRKRVEHVFATIEAPAGDLRLISSLLAILETQQFESLWLRERREALIVSGKTASKRVHLLSRWSDWLDSSDHVVMRLLRPFTLSREIIAMSIEQWRVANGGQVVRWLRAIGDFEASSALASLRFERPSWTIPELVNSDKPSFEAQQLRHPLLPTATCVPNDITLKDPQRLWIVSGSNMSGKSTLLRTIGLNTVLALAGAPVSARSLRVAPLAVGASLRASDSLQDNKSRFMAEIERLKAIVDLTEHNRHVLFLLDELLSGTNSHDRGIGALGLIRNLLDRNTIGLVTTHDLALTKMEQDLNPYAANVHLEDKLVEGQLEFDYRLQQGVVTHSNALELMRAVGLKLN